ncbi:NotI family restriction endonuclease [Cerasicoccus fimbriatus]|uniref:NotI family restriction endonuclease n=1 Tax=Cerasicoccus fimbriatus TaxID=3014554 RepID=UPI0022B41549|nr:NotI family restriction endonuclease [Cerasicoccus sp. TK19100]
MASTIYEFFGYRSDDQSDRAVDAAQKELCPIINERCEKTFNDGIVSGVCSVKPMTTGPVICCPIRLYADNYKILSDVALKAFEERLELVTGPLAIAHAKSKKCACVAVFGKRKGGELRLPQKSGSGSYFVDWILAKIDSNGQLVEFIAVEVQTIDTTGNYRNGYHALTENRQIVKTTAGLNWENVSKRILPQLIYKGQVLQREELCKKGLFFVCPEPVYRKIMTRLGGKEGLVKYSLQPASISFLAYDFKNSANTTDAELVKLERTSDHSTTVYKVQEAFNNVTLPEENVYKKAILKALNSES